MAANELLAVAIRYYSEKQKKIITDMLGKKIMY